MEIVRKNEQKYIIAIDPDVKANGVCLIKPGGYMMAKTMSFGQTLDFIAEHKECKVVIEAGWMNESNWHIKPSMPARLAARIGKNQGENHQRGKDIIEWCEHNGIRSEAQRPLKKCWKGADGKITQSELEYIVGKKLQRMNQDVRDAILLAWCVAGYPIKVRTYAKKTE